MSRLMSANVIARSGRAVEAAGDVDVLLLDKTGTITSAIDAQALSIRRQASRLKLFVKLRSFQALPTTRLKENPLSNSH